MLLYGYWEARTSHHRVLSLPTSSSLPFRTHTSHRRHRRRYTQLMTSPCSTDTRESAQNNSTNRIHHLCQGMHSSPSNCLLAHYAVYHLHTHNDGHQSAPHKRIIVSPTQKLHKLPPMLYVYHSKLLDPCISGHTTQTLVLEHWHPRFQSKTSVR